MRLPSQSWTGSLHKNEQKISEYVYSAEEVVSVRLFGVHPNAIAVFTPAQKIHTKGGNEPEFVLIKLNKTGVNTPLS